MANDRTAELLAELRALQSAGFDRLNTGHAQLDTRLGKLTDAVSALDTRVAMCASGDSVAELKNEITSLRGDIDAMSTAVKDATSTGRITNERLGELVVFAKKRDEREAAAAKREAEREDADAQHEREVSKGDAEERRLVRSTLMKFLPYVVVAIMLTVFPGMGQVLVPLLAHYIGVDVTAMVEPPPAAPALAPAPAPPPAPAPVLGAPHSIAPSPAAELAPAPE